MKWLDDWRDRRTLAENRRWDREHRWDRLGKYNAEVSRGIVHTPEYDAWMKLEQGSWTAEMRQKYPPWPDLLDVTA